MKRAPKIALGIVAAIVVLLAIPVIIIAVSFAGTAAIPDGKELPGGASTVKDGHVAAFVIPAGDGQLMLVDCGNDPSGKPLLSEVARRGLTADNVEAIFLTHGHRDHVAGCHLFPKARMFAMGAEVPLLQGEASSRGPMTRWMPRHDSGVRVSYRLHDGESVMVGNRVVTAYAVPGHTAGSAAYLIAGTLYLGDAADATKDGKVIAAKWAFSEDQAQDRSSLMSLARRLEPRANEVQVLAFAHSGVLNGLGPLRELR